MHTSKHIIVVVFILWKIWVFEAPRVRNASPCGRAIISHVIKEETVQNNYEACALMAGLLYIAKFRSGHVAQPAHTCSLPPVYTTLPGQLSLSGSCCSSSGCCTLSPRLNWRIAYLCRSGVKSSSQWPLGPRMPASDTAGGWAPFVCNVPKTARPQLFPNLQLAASLLPSAGALVSSFPW